MTSETKDREPGGTEPATQELYNEGLSSQEELDRDQLMRMGKVPVLKRNFSFLALLGFSCTVLITWEGSLILIGQGLNNGGPAGVIYGFIFIWLGNLSVFSTLSELASMAPTSGGQYHWVAMLAPRSCAKFLSYITGWLAIGGWQGSVATALFVGGSMIQSFIILTVPDYEPKAFHVTLLFLGICLLCVFINAWGSAVLARFENLVLVIHVLGFFGIIVAVIVLSPHQDASFVFTKFINNGNFSTQGLSFFVGLIGNVFAFVGVDGAFHLSEEVHNPSKTIPQATMFSLLINGSTGFAMMIAVIFCMGDFDAAINNRYGFLFVQLFYNMTGTIKGAAGLSSLIWILAFAATVGIFASTSRVFWSFARDRGLPGWRTLSKVHPTTGIPLWAVGFTALISALLSLLNLGSTTAFNDVVSLGVSGLYSSYLIPAGLLLYRRCTGGFRMPDSTALPALANTTGAEIIWGPWHIPGVIGILNNSFACIYLVIILIFSFFPPAADVDYTTMNYSVLVTGGVAILSTIYYLVWARREYRGPVVEVQHDQWVVNEVLHQKNQRSTRFGWITLLLG